MYVKMTAQLTKRVQSHITGERHGQADIPGFARSDGEVEAKKSGVCEGMAEVEHPSSPGEERAREEDLKRASVVGALQGWLATCMHLPSCRQVSFSCLGVAQH